MSIELVVNRCSCGWQFYALNEWVKKCPQCRDVVYTCRNCGKEIEPSGRRKYCKECADITKKIYNKYYSEEKRKNPYTFKQKMKADNICNYDCANCQFSDCILPVDPDDKQEELF